MKLTAAASILGVDRHALTREAVRAAFVEAARATHPDQGGSGADMARIKLARDVLMREVEAQESLVECPRCNGHGGIKTRGPRVTCPACGGEGVVKRRD